MPTVSSGFTGGFGAMGATLTYSGGSDLFAGATPAFTPPTYSISKKDSDELNVNVNSAGHIYGTKLWCGIFNPYTGELWLKMSDSDWQLYTSLPATYQHFRTQDIKPGDNGIAIVSPGSGINPLEMAGLELYFAVGWRDTPGGWMMKKVATL